MPELFPPSLWPTDVFRWTARTAAGAASVPARVLALLTTAEAVVARADELVRRTDQVITAATEAVADAGRVTAAAEEQLTAARPLLTFVEEFSQHEINAAIKLVDELPRLARHLDEDVLPILRTLGHVGPDIHELLAVANDVRQAILGIPGFAFLRRRGEERDEADDDRADDD